MTVPMSTARPDPRGSRIANSVNNVWCWVLEVVVSRFIMSERRLRCDVSRPSRVDQGDTA